MIQLMVVDDETSARDDMIAHIDWAKNGITVVGAADDGQSAYRMILEKKPDIVLIDIEMPGMNGLEVIRKVRRESDLTPAFIIVSGYDDFSYAQQAISLSVDEYLLKPFLPRHVLEAVHRAVERLELTGRASAPSFFKFYDQFVSGKLPNIDYPSEEELGLIRAILLEGEREAMDAFESFWETAQASNPETSSLLSCGLLLYMSVFRHLVERGQTLVDNPFLTQQWETTDAPGALRDALLRFVLSVRLHLSQTGKRGQDSPVRRATDYIQAHYRDNLSLEGVAKESYVTPSYLSGLFTHTLGVSFVEYVSRVRIEHAKVLLSKPSLKNYEIAEQVGFSDHKYFAQVFKKITGLPPSEYREQIV